MKKKQYFILFVQIVAACGLLYADKSGEIATSSKVPVVRIEGTITEERRKEFIGEVLRLVDGKVHKVVIFIDSAGGSVSDVIKMAEIIHSSRIESWAYVCEATYASIFLPASCDHIVMDKNGIIGGGGMLSRDFEMLDDKTFNSVKAFFLSELRKITDDTGHDFEVFRAMFDHNMELKRNEKSWKEPKQILSLTSIESEEIGISEGTYESTSVFMKHMEDKCQPVAGGDATR